MLFDKLCGIAERRLDPRWANYLRQAALIHIPEVWEDTFARGVVVTYEEIFERFFLPFPIVAVEDPDGLVLFRYVHHTDPSQPGIRPTDQLECLIFFDLNCGLRKQSNHPSAVVRDIATAAKQYGTDRMPPFHSIYATVTNFQLLPASQIDPQRTEVRRWSQESPDPNSPLLGVDHSDLYIGFGDKHRFVFQNFETLGLGEFGAHKIAEDDFLRAVIVALRQIMVINWPGNWLLKSHGEQAKPTGSKGRAKIPRSHQRPRYLLITDQQRIRYFRHESGDCRKSPVAHVRRAHWRKIGVNPDTNTPVHTRVRAAWIGSKIATINGVRYEVQLDL